MSKQDFGFVIARAVAVLIFSLALPQLFSVTGMLIEAERFLAGSSKGTLLMALATPLAQMGTCILLWSNADRFAGKDRADGDLPSSTSGLFAVLCAAIGVWIMVVGIAHTVAALTAPKMSDETYIYATTPSLTASLVELALGAALVLIFRGAFIDYFRANPYLEPEA